MQCTLLTHLVKTAPGLQREAEDRITGNRKGCPTMTETDPAIYDLSRMRPGTPIEVWDHGVIRHHGIVEETAPKLGVVWIRDTGTGERKLLSTTDYDLRRP